MPFASFCPCSDGIPLVLLVALVMLVVVHVAVALVAKLVFVLAMFAIVVVVAQSHLGYAIAFALGTIVVVDTRG